MGELFLNEYFWVRVLTKHVGVYEVRFLYLQHFVEIVLFRIDWIELYLGLHFFVSDILLVSQSGRLGVQGTQTLSSV